MSEGEREECARLAGEIQLRCVNCRCALFGLGVNQAHTAYGNTGAVRARESCEDKFADDDALACGACGSEGDLHEGQIRRR
jgi:hypothetical protein